MTVPIDLRLGTLGLLALALAGWSGWSRPTPSAEVAVAARGTAWAAIDWKPADVAAAAQLLAQRNTWGWADGRGGGSGPGPAAPGAGPARPPTPVETGPWRVVGTADWGEGLAAIVQTQPPGTPRPQFVFRRPGESLPDGRVVVSVDPARIEVQRPGGSGAETAILLFRPQP
jgi:hypothetical protein